MAMKPKCALSYAVAGGIPKRSLMVADVVGTVLNLINQGDAMFGAASINWLKALLTYIVPAPAAAAAAPVEEQTEFTIMLTNEGR
jgi:hypothetical protein